MRASTSTMWRQGSMSGSRGPVSRRESRSSLIRINCDRRSSECDSRAFLGGAPGSAREPRLAVPGRLFGGHQRNGWSRRSRKCRSPRQSSPALQTPVRICGFDQPVRSVRSKPGKEEYGNGGLMYPSVSDTASAAVGREISQTGAIDHTAQSECSTNRDGTGRIQVHGPGKPGHSLRRAVLTIAGRSATDFSW